MGMEIYGLIVKAGAHNLLGKDDVITDGSREIADEMTQDWTQIDRIAQRYDW